MGIPQRRAGRYSPADGLLLPAQGYTGKADIPCPDVGPDARSWWATWATHPVAWLFSSIEWQDLADTARLMDAYYREGNPRSFAEARQHMNAYFGLATRARLHVAQEGEDGDPDSAPHPPRRDAPRLRAV